MTMVTTPTAGRHQDARFAGFIGGMTKRFAQYSTYRRTLDELNTLTERELADLGISRAQIRSIAYKAAYDG